MRLKSLPRQFLRMIQRKRTSKKGATQTLQLPGLIGEVEILTDAFGIAHIYADHQDDLFFAQGYVTARDRLFQMDFSRHAARGRLCEMIGKRPVKWQKLSVHLKNRNTYDIDVMMRTFGLEHGAKESMLAHSEESRAMMRSYAAGVNAYLKDNPRALEHKILRYTSPAWLDEDCLVMVKAMAFQLNVSWRAILFGSMLKRADLPDDVAQTLWPQYPTGGPTIVQKQLEEYAVSHQAAHELLNFNNASGVGSNGFVIAASHSNTHSALLANDTHLNMMAPCSWHEIHLCGGGLDVRGFSLPGVPGVSIGRTAHHAWGITAALIQDLDLFVEKVDPNDPKRYLTPQGSEAFKVRTETFKIRGNGQHDRPILESRHGPILETLGETDPQHRLAVSWTGHRVGKELDAFFGVWRAKSFAEFKQALVNHCCPLLNVMYADSQGHIGYVLAGTLPNRKKGAPLRALEGWTGEWDWQADAPKDMNPYVLDPKEGFIVTANNRVAPRDFPYELGELFESPERYKRITKLLHALGKNIGKEDLRQIQLDVFSHWGCEIRDALLRVVGGADGLQPQNTHEQVAAQLWSGWDGQTHVDNPGATVAYMTAFAVAQTVVKKLAHDEAAFAFIELGDLVTSSILRLVKMRERLSDLGVELAEVVRDEFRKTVTDLRAKLGDDPKRWHWGKVHKLVCRHFLDGTPLGPFFNIGPEPFEGASDTVNRGDVFGTSFNVRVGAAMRFVTDLADLDSSETVLPGGQSGNRLSVHYDDQLPMFLKGDLKSAPLTKIDGVTREILVS
jgi:penicillin G amidase